jgi:hypothetical protein
MSGGSVFTEFFYEIQERVIMDYLEPKDGPVFEGQGATEVVFAKNQPQYKPLRCSVDDSRGDRRVTSRWTLTDEQRKAIANGADIYLTLLTHGNPLQPILLGVE